MISMHDLISDRSLRIIAQLAFVASGAVVTFGYPIFFGIGVYGAFVVATASTFIVQKIIDITAESQIMEPKPWELIQLCTLLIIVTIFIFKIVGPILPSHTQLHYGLLISLALSTLVNNMCYQLGNARIQAAYAVLFLAVNLAIAVCWRLSRLDNLTLALVLVNFSGFIIGFLLLAHKMIRDDRAKWTGFHFPKLGTQLIVLPWRLGLASLPITITFGTSLLAQSLNNEQIGNLRLLTTIAMMGTTITPINPKAYYVLMRDVDRPAKLLQFFRHNAVPFSMIFIAWLLTVSVAIYLKWEVNHPYIVGICSYPAILLGSMIEKLVLHRRGLSLLGGLSACYAAAIAIVVIHGSGFASISQAIILLLVIYPVVLTMTLARNFLPFAIVAAVIAGLAYSAFVATANIKVEPTRLQTISEQR